MAHFGFRQGPWGNLGGAEGRPQRAPLGKQAALQNHWFYFINGYILALEKGLGGTRGGRGGGKNGRRRVEWGPRRPPKKQKQNERSRRGKAGTPRAPQMHSDHLPWPSPGPKYRFYLHKTNVFACLPWALEGAPGGLWGGAWGPQGSPQGLLGDPLGGSGPSLGGPWGTLGQPWGAEGRPQRALLENRRLCKIIGFIT